MNHEKFKVSQVLNQISGVTFHILFRKGYHHIHFQLEETFKMKTFQSEFSMTRLLCEPYVVKIVTLQSWLLVHLALCLLFNITSSLRMFFKSQF